MRKILLASCLICLPLMAVAQNEDRDYLTAFLEDSLSGAGHKVVVTGFAGALSSQATLTELTIADAENPQAILYEYRLNREETINTIINRWVNNVIDFFVDHF